MVELLKARAIDFGFRRMVAEVTPAGGELLTGWKQTEPGATLPWIASEEDIGDTSVPPVGLEFGAHDDRHVAFMRVPRKATT